ncbi:MAG TPA: cytochrome P450 [Solirubrobacteraceae bacterium]|nr:cytochrome P450 [Solirubrobacteraceae bacterium]
MTTTHALLSRIKGDLPPTPPIPGSMQTLACRWMPLGLFEWCRRNLGERFTLYPVDLPPVVFLSNPAEIRAVMGAPGSVLQPGAGGSAIAPIVGPSSFMLHEADEHMRGRRTILPSFTTAAVEEHAQRLTRIIAAEVASWPLDSPFAVLPRLRSMSLRIILGTVFRAEEERLRRLHHHMLRMLDVTASFVLVEPRLRHLPVWRGIWRRFTEERAQVDEEIRALIDDARATHGEDVLGRLLAASNQDGSPLSPVQVRDNLVSVILAGHETTASEAAWALQLIAHAPAVQKRLAEEIETGSGEGYLQATVTEVLRHRPVFLFAIPRVVAAPFELGGWTYRPPVQLLACIYLLHHDRALYRDPHLFLPERFLSAAPEPSSWLPWGGGRKRCPGHRLATLELQTLIRATLSTRTVLPASRQLERARWRSVIVTPAKGGRLRLSARPPQHVRR